MKKIILILSILLSGIYLSNFILAISVTKNAGEVLDNSTWGSIASIADKLSVSGSNMNINGKIYVSGDLCDNNGNCLGKCNPGYIWDNDSFSCKQDEFTDETRCKNAGWFWVNGTLDTVGDGYCISPRITGGTEFISWGDIGTDYGRTRTSETLVGSGDNRYGATNNLGNYTCKALGNATTDFDTTNGEGDTVYNRMKWLADNKTSSTALDDIDWVTVPDKPATLSTPALYLSDCIDGERDLSDSNIYEGVTYNEYSNGTSRINMNKYLLGRTKDSGGHLPSAFSDISSELVYILNTNKGEYQIACENNLLTDSSDSEDNKWIMLSATGDWPGTGRGQTVRQIGGRENQGQGNACAGGRQVTSVARFIVRP